MAEQSLNSRRLLGKVGISVIDGAGFFWREPAENETQMHGAPPKIGGLVSAAAVNEFARIYQSIARLHFCRVGKTGVGLLLIVRPEVTTGNHPSGAQFIGNIMQRDHRA